jgi:protein SCO1/2
VVVDKNFFFKLGILVIIVVMPIVILLLNSKEHTFIEQDKILSKGYNQYFKEEYTLLYIGYTGCVNICTPRLTELSTIQRVLNDKGNKINYMFLDLRTLGDDVSRDFLKAFEGSFEVLSLDEDKKNQLLRELEFYYSQSFYDSNEFEHSSYLYLIQKEDDKVKLVATVMQYTFLNDNTIDFLHKKVNNETKENSKKD